MIGLIMLTHATELDYFVPLSTGSEHILATPFELMAHKRNELDYSPLRTVQFIFSVNPLVH